MKRPTIAATDLICGFSGTSKGMAPRQLKTVRQLLYHVVELHLGDCIGADKQAHAEAVRLGIRTVGHLPTVSLKRAYCTYDEERKPKDYLLRNRDIAIAGTDGLIATPAGFVEEQRSGTWATVRYARAAGRKIWIVRPDGTIQEEN